MKSKKEYKKSSDGFTILYAIFLTTIVLTIGLSLLGVLIQQVSLSGAERESELSFYTADAGMECALYWDNVKDAFIGGTAISCNGVSLGAISNRGTPANPTYVFKATFSTGCSEIRVLKTIVSGAVTTTTVQSRGYNTVCPPAASLKPWRLERALQTDY